MSDIDIGAASSARGACRGIAALAIGAVFGVGLGLAQMVDPLKVLGFLDVSGAWDASLVFVLGGAVVVTAIGYRFVLRLPAPQFDGRFQLPTARSVDVGLVVGAAIFGIGWGLAGYCPGPAFASLGFGNAEALWFVPPMIIGAGLQRWQSRGRAAS